MFGLDVCVLCVTSTYVCNYTLPGTRHEDVVSGTVIVATVIVDFVVSTRHCGDNITGGKIVSSALSNKCPHVCCEISLKVR